MKHKVVLQLLALLAYLLCSFNALAKEAYVCRSSITLTFYYDDLRSDRTGRTYDLNTGDDYPDWTSDSHDNLRYVVFDSSFSDVRPTSTAWWFYSCTRLQSISGLQYLNTSEVTDMSGMFCYCHPMMAPDLSHFNTEKVTSMTSMFASSLNIVENLDLSSFNTVNVTNMEGMFYGCDNLTTITVGEGWNTDAVTSSRNMFFNCTSLVGGKGTTYDENHVDKAYAHIDGGSSNPGYFTAKFKLGDVNGDDNINVADVTALIAAILNSTPLDPAVADINGDDQINVADVTALIQVILNQ